MKCFGGTDRGKHRTDNQDCYFAGTVNGYGVLIVCDGVGGSAGGFEAAYLACDTLVSALASSLGTSFSVKECVERAVSKANYTVLGKAKSSEMFSMSTTLVMAVADGDTAVLVNVGDSRGYLYRGGSLQTVTRDHSVVQELMEMGQLTAKEAATHPHRHVITKAIGIDELTEPSIYQLSLEEGDRLLLCSDGLSDMLTPAQMEDCMLLKNEKEVVQTLILKANEAGGVDNITATVLTR